MQDSSRYKKIFPVCWYLYTNLYTRLANDFLGLKERVGCDDSHCPESPRKQQFYHPHQYLIWSRQLPPGGINLELGWFWFSWLDFWNSYLIVPYMHLPLSIFCYIVKGFKTWWLKLTHCLSHSFCEKLAYCRYSFGEYLWLKISHEVAINVPAKGMISCENSTVGKKGRTRRASCKVTRIVGCFHISSPLTLASTLLPHCS